MITPEHAMGLLDKYPDFDSMSLMDMPDACNELRDCIVGLLGQIAVLQKQCGQLDLSHRETGFSHLDPSKKFFLGVRLISDAFGSVSNDLDVTVNPLMVLTKMREGMIGDLMQVMSDTGYAQLQDVVQRHSGTILPDKHEHNRPPTVRVALDGSAVT